MLGCAVGDSEDGAFWTAFLRLLKARGLGAVQLVISDAHIGLKADNVFCHTPTSRRPRRPSRPHGDPRPRRRRYR